MTSHKNSLAWQWSAAASTRGNLLISQSGKPSFPLKTNRSKSFAMNWNHLKRITWNDLLKPFECPFDSVHSEKPGLQAREIKKMFGYKKFVKKLKFNTYKVIKSLQEHRTVKPNRWRVIWFKTECTFDLSFLILKLEFQPNQSNFLSAFIWHSFEKKLGG